MIAVHRAIARNGRRSGVIERPTPEPGPGQLLLAPEKVSLCGTDIVTVPSDDLDRRQPTHPGAAGVAPVHEDPAPVVGHEGAARVLDAEDGAWSKVSFRARNTSVGTTTCPG